MWELRKKPWILLIGFSCFYWAWFDDSSPTVCQQPHPRGRSGARSYEFYFIFFSVAMVTSRKMYRQKTFYRSGPSRGSPKLICHFLVPLSAFFWIANSTRMIQAFFLDTIWDWTWNVSIKHLLLPMTATSQIPQLWN